MGPVLYLIISLTGAFLIGWLTAWWYGKDQRKILDADIEATNIKLDESLDELGRTRISIQELREKLTGAIDAAAFEDLRSRYDSLEQDHIELERKVTLRGHEKPHKEWSVLDGLGLSITGEVPPSKKDDLTLITGISPFIQERLNQLGICSFDQISKLSDQQVRLVNEAIEILPGRIRKERWVEQSKTLIMARRH